MDWTDLNNVLWTRPCFTSDNWPVGWDMHGLVDVGHSTPERIIVGEATAGKLYTDPTGALETDPRRTFV